MGIDHNEAKRQRTVDKQKLSTKHPIAGYLTELKGSGLAGRQGFQIPRRGVLQ